MTKRAAAKVTAKLDALDRTVQGMKNQRKLSDERFADIRTILDELKALDTEGVFIREEDRCKLREALSTALDL